MRCGKTSARLNEDVENFRDRSWPLGEPLAEREAAYEFHGDEDAVFKDPGVEDGYHIGVGEACHGLCLAQEADMALGSPFPRSDKV
ncbi:MAG TPA: hypothetical protein VMK12_30645 [Anaeromyxobacteraceae bacterium]|nr:hypothetical protein [Anaeromyxobacteraceae bacterium]